MPSSASAVGQEEQPWLVNSSTTAFGSSTALDVRASAASEATAWACAGVRQASKAGNERNEREKAHVQDSSFSVFDGGQS